MPRRTILEGIETGLKPAVEVTPRRLSMKIEENSGRDPEPVKEGQSPTST